MMAACQLKCVNDSVEIHGYDNIVQQYTGNSTCRCGEICNSKRDFL